ncbi:MAG: hypothetical protein FD125_1798 [bacterium]|nr:MAG: hypothetical protein FD125_1798 [bacterium]
MTGWRAHLVSREVLPFYLSLLMLGGGALALDAILHLLHVVWIGRWLGIPGTLLIIGSFGYSLARRKWIKVAAPAGLMRLHERMAWAGSLLILVHAGIHFNAILAWLAVWAMLINIASGLTGKFLMKRARVRLEETRARLRTQGMSEAALEESLHWDSLTFDVVRRWRAVHYPVSLAFGVLALAHILAVFWHWRWR